ncbi:hypothetical protein [Streptomyces sp. XD-27]|nr:hypothetical protein [Streptomyces sp. XD-27]WKX68680.1 hypothetical protein Q3Y56_00865 [Streptomyces sp. XD-27]
MNGLYPAGAAEDGAEAAETGFAVAGRAVDDLFSRHEVVALSRAEGVG